MNDVGKLVAELRKFIEFFKEKYKYDQRGVLKRLRLKSGLNKQLGEDMWCKLFIEKTAFNYCAKFLLIKLYEDNKIIPCKLNTEGLKKWGNLVSSKNGLYNKLYEIAESDILNIDEMKSIFKESDYDIYKIDNDLAEFMISNLKKYNFTSYNQDMIYNIFNDLYTDEKKYGLNLQYFYKPARAIEYIISLKEKEDAVQ